MGPCTKAVSSLLMVRARGVKTIGLTGTDGGALGRVVDVHLNVPSPTTARIQEVHITVSHIICELVDVKLFQRPDAR